MNRKDRRAQKKTGAGLPQIPRSGGTRSVIARSGATGISDMLMRLGGVPAAAPLAAVAADAPLDPVHSALAQLRLTEKLAAELKRQEQALHDHPQSIALLHAVARLQVRLDRRADALLTFRRLQEVEPAHTEAAHMIAVLSGRAPDQPDAAYVEKLFDDFADSFDDKLTNWLDYKAPQHVAAAVRAAAPPANARAIDLGCGTGLLGPEVRSLCVRLDGVDLSSRMIEKARQRGGYDTLIVGEIVATLQPRRGAYDLVFAADVLSYFGDLRAVFAAVHDALHDNGIFAATVEKGAGARYHAAKTGRYQHGEAYLHKRAAEAGFAVLSLDEVVLRREENLDVLGYVFVLRRLAADEPGAEVALSTDELLAGLDAPGAALMLAAARQVLGQGYTVGWAVDLGGHLGRHVAALRELAQHVDMVSPDAARSRRAFEAGIYDDCDTEALVAFLEERPDHFDLILAADLQPLLVDLPQFFSAVKIALAVAGAFIGLVPGDSYSEASLREMAKAEGLIVLAAEPIVLPDGRTGLCLVAES
jgi:predicted TPR repeat methyltransferase